MGAMVEWGFIPPWVWQRLDIRHKALYSAMLEDIWRRREEAMKK